MAYGVKLWLVDRQRDPETGKDMHFIGADLELRMKMDIELMKKIKCQGHKARPQPEGQGAEEDPYHRPWRHDGGRDKA